MRALASLGRRFIHAEDGSSTLEFVIVVPVIMLFLANSVESGVILTRKALLERGLDMAVRDLRINTESPPSFAEFRDDICARTPSIPNCSVSLQVQLTPLKGDSLNDMLTTINCINSSSVEPDPAELKKGTTYQTGVSNEIMLVRACATYKPMFPKFGIGAALPDDESGHYRVAALSAFVQEP
ncbi:MAG: TadE/TadG family type IV pilus assembly protein [Jannaschia sp.]